MQIRIILCQLTWISAYLLFGKFENLTKFNEVSVILVFSEAKVEAHLEETAGKEGQTCSLTCQFSMPNVKTQWFKNGKLLEPSSRYTFTVIDTIQRLSIKDLRPEDQGQYTCKYDNLESTTNLWVEGLYKSENISNLSVVPTY